MLRLLCSGYLCLPTVWKVVSKVVYTRRNSYPCYQSWKLSAWEWSAWSALLYSVLLCLLLLCLLLSSIFYFSLLFYFQAHGYRVNRTLCVFSLQFRVFGSGQASGQGVSGWLYPRGHSLRRTPRWGKKLSCTTQILLTGCLYLTCLTSPMELNWVAAEKKTKSFTMKCQLWHYVKRRILEAMFGNTHSVIIITIILKKKS